MNDQSVFDLNSLPLPLFPKEIADYLNGVTDTFENPHYIPWHNDEKPLTLADLSDDELLEEIGKRRLRQEGKT